MELQDENRGSLEAGEQIRWQFQVPESGTLFTLEVDQGEVVFYASTKTTAPNEAFHQWKIQTPLSTSVFIKPTIQSNSNNARSIEKRNAELDSNETLIPVFTAIIGLSGNNTFTLTSDDSPPTTEQMITTSFTTELDESTTELDESTMLTSPSGKFDIIFSERSSDSLAIYILVQVFQD